MLVPVLIGLGSSGKFVGSEMVVQVGIRVTTQSVSNAVFNPGIRQYMLNAGARYHTRREGLAFNDDGRFRNYRFYVQGSQPTSIQRGAEFGKAAIRVAEIAMAEIVFPAEVQAQISAHPRALSLQESHQASDMVVVAVADNERIHLGDIDLENFEVVRVNAGREAEVEQEATAFLALAGLDMQRQPPLAFQVLPCCAAGNPTRLTARPGAWAPRREISCALSVTSRIMTSSTTGTSIRTGAARADRSSGMLHVSSEPPSTVECCRKVRRSSERGMCGLLTYITSVVGK